MARKDDPTAWGKEYIAPIRDPFGAMYDSDAVFLESAEQLLRMSEAAMWDDTRKDTPRQREDTLG
jgi:hypothetical protein